MKILVTGGAGFIASHIVDKYIELGHEVVVIDNLTSGNKDFINKKAIFYHIDIRDKSKVTEIFQKEKPEILNHHAAQISVRNSVEDPIFDANVNIIGFLNLLEAGRSNGLKKIIFASSGGAIYGDTAILPTPEDHSPQNPLSPYGITKLAGEKYLYFYNKSYSIPYVALRYGNVYGPRQNPHGEAGVIAIFSLKITKGEKPVINGDGKQTRDYIYVSDVVEANVRALKTNYSGSINIGTAKETNVNQLFQSLKSISTSTIVPRYGPARKGEQSKSCLDISLADKYLLWRPNVNIDEGLSLTMDYFEKKLS